MLQVAHSPHLTSCDPFQKSHYNNLALDRISEAGLSHRHTHLSEFSDRALPTLLKENRSFDFIFIDGDHKFSGAFIDFHYAAQLLKPGGILVFHDMWMRSLLLIAAYIQNNRTDFRRIKLQSGNLSAFQKVGEDLRDGMAFKEFYTPKGVLKYHINRLAWENKTVIGKTILTLKNLLKQ